MLVVSGASGTVALELTQDVRWVGTSKLCCGNLWAVADRRVLVGLDGVTWRIAAVTDGRISMPVRSVKWAAPADWPTVEDTADGVIVRTRDAAWRIDGVADDAATFDPKPR